MAVLSFFDPTLYKLVLSVRHGNRRSVYESVHNNPCRGGSPFKDTTSTSADILFVLFGSANGNRTVSLSSATKLVWLSNSTLYQPTTGTLLVGEAKLGVPWTESSIGYRVFILFIYPKAWLPGQRIRLCIQMFSSRFVSSDQRRWHVFHVRASVTCHWPGGSMPLALVLASGWERVDLPSGQVCSVVALHSMRCPPLTAVRVRPV